MSGKAADDSAPAEILPASHWATQEPDKGDDGAETTLVSFTGSSTTSLGESIRSYRELHGRTYHSERGNAQYWAANDQKQRETMDILHHMNMMLFDGKIYQAPLDKGIKKALDIGTGTGNWAFDFAEEFPDCEVIGTDISPIQPTWVPANLRFEIEDCTGAWAFPDSSVDYVHIRWLLGSVPDWKALFAEAYRVLKPGGWLESVEPSDRIEGANGAVKPTDALGQWHQLFRAGGKIIGRDFDIYDRETQKTAFEEVRFEQIQSRDVKIPLSRWPASSKWKEIGTMAQAHFTHDTEGFMLFLAATQGWTREEITSYIELLHREVKSVKKQAQYAQRVVWGRKPESAT